MKNAGKMNDRNWYVDNIKTYGLGCKNLLNIKWSDSRTTIVAMHMSGVSLAVTFL